MDRRFRYNLSSDTISDGDSNEFSGVLDIYVHHARNIHNICIYENQDVYAKFSLTCDPDEALSTRIVNGGGKNPDFNQNLRMKITHPDSVLKCEIWMLSRVRNYMEDQLLGFALVPVLQLAGKPKLTQDYTLSSTDLFHSPAGTVHLTLSLATSSLPLDPSSDSPASSSITSEVVLLDRKASEASLDPVEYSRIEFPDISTVSENRKMVSEYFGMSEAGSEGVASFLRLGSLPNPFYDCEMTANSSDETHGGDQTVSPQNSGFFSSTTTEDRNSADSVEKNRAATESFSNTAETDTPTSKKGREGSREQRDSGSSSNKKDESDKERSNESRDGSAQFGQVFSAQLEAEQSAMQQQIVDMYMRSMQQFTESLAKMKLPMELNQSEASKDSNNNDMVNNDNSNKLEIEKKKDGSRVFYGSRAFF